MPINSVRNHSDSEGHRMPSCGKGNRQHQQPITTVGHSFARSLMVTQLVESQAMLRVCMAAAAKAPVN